MPVDKFGRMSDLKTKDTGVSLTYINNNYVRSDGETPLTGSLDMRGNTLYNVADPVNPQDVVTKVYVDNTKGSGVIGRKVGDAVSIKENLDFLGKQKIKNLPDPVNDHDAVTKEYVDSKGNFLELDNPFKFKDNIYEAKDNINLKGFKISEVSLPSEDGDVATKEYIDTAAAAYLQEDQGKYTVKGDIDMGNTYTLFNVKPPIDKGDIVDKKYVDDNIPFKKFNNGFFATDEIIMRKKKLGGLREPTQDGEAATKKYVDDLQTQYVDAKGNIKFSRNINLDNKRIFALKEPRKDNEAANKKYVDDTVVERIEEEKANFLPKDPATKTYVDEAIKGLAGGDILVSKEGVFIKANGHYRATAPLDIDNHKMENLPDPVDDKDAVNKKYIDGIIENLTLKQGLIRENGGFNLVDSYINMNFHNIRNVGLPKHEADAVPRRFVDSEIKEVEEKIQKIKEKSEERLFLKENGNYQASTSINMNFNKLLNLQKPTEPYDAATKDYVDYVGEEIKLEKKPHLIAVHARYCGPLKKDEYQFKFNGGGNFKGCDESLGKYKDFKGSITGFVIPHSGHIKKIICEGLTFKDIDSFTEFTFNYISDNEKDLVISDIYPIDKTGYTDIKDVIEKGIDELKKRIIEVTTDLTGLKFDFNSINNVRFEIVKFEKSLNPKDYPTLKTQPKITSSVLIKKLKSVLLEFKDDNVAFGSIFRGVNNEYVALSEGDVINIKSMFDYTERDFSINEKKSFIYNVTIANYLFSSASYNFTFLIELDPL